MSWAVMTDDALDHFMNPRNAGEMADADAKGTCGDPDCGDYLALYIKVRKDIITDVSFMVCGCAAAIATSSMTTVLAKGRTLDDAYTITKRDITDALGGLPEEKLHCSVLGATALRRAIDAYREHNKCAGPSCAGESV
jgi:nitrogen fixation NifU-like protein